jgi:hypothetical protein
MDSVVMNSSSNELTNNAADNSSFATAVTGSVTLQ